MKKNGAENITLPHSTTSMRRLIISYRKCINLFHLVQKNDRQSKFLRWSRVERQKWTLSRRCDLPFSKQYFVTFSGNKLQIPAWISTYSYMHACSDICTTRRCTTTTVDLNDVSEARHHISDIMKI